MSGSFRIRPTTASDAAAVDTLYGQAFPAEDLLPLVHDLLAGGDDVLSLAATRDGSIIGHVAFTRCSADGCATSLALLGPLAVAPAAQRQGVGRSLVGEGLGRLAEGGVDIVLVLGSPVYYGRLGFAQESAIVPPYPLLTQWLAAWQSRRLRRDATPGEGRLRLPEAWLRPRLWAP